MRINVHADHMDSEIDTQFIWNQYLVIATRGASGHVIFATMADGKVGGARDSYAYDQDPGFQWENDTTNRLTVVGQGTKFSIFTNGIKIGEVDPTAPVPDPSLPEPPDRPANLLDSELTKKYQAQVEQYEQVKDEITSRYLARKQEAQAANKKFDRGFVAMTVLSESGRTTCEFTRAWLWLLD
jgi:hypothetical protein